MPGKLTREKAAQYRAEAVADLKHARATGREAWVIALRKRIEFLDEYWARHFGPVADRNGLDSRVPPTTET